MYTPTLPTLVSNLTLQNNRLSGSIPAELGNLANLTDLALNDNQLSGSIPTQLGNLSALVKLYLNDNSLTGPLPSEFANLRNLRRLALKNNKGVCIPDAQAVDIDFRIWASWLENWHTLSEGVLTCDGNVFERAPQNVDAVEFKALVALYEATDGPNWTNNTNWLSGRDLDDWYGIETRGANQRIAKLTLHGNGLNGQIPAAIGDLRYLTYLQMERNSLTGGIPSEIGNLSRMIHLDLSHNALTGSIPAALGSMSELLALDLSENQLSGSVPEELADLPKLRELVLFNNPDICVPTDILPWMKSLRYFHKNRDGVLLDCDGNPVFSPVQTVPPPPADDPDERAALVALYNAIGGANWTNTQTGCPTRPSAPGTAFPPTPPAA